MSYSKWWKNDSFFLKTKWRLIRSLDDVFALKKQYARNFAMFQGIVLEKKGKNGYFLAFNCPIIPFFGQNDPQIFGESMEFVYF